MSVLWRVGPVYSCHAIRGAEDTARIQTIAMKILGGLVAYQLGRDLSVWLIGGGQPQPSWLDFLLVALWRGRQVNRPTAAFSHQRKFWQSCAAVLAARRAGACIIISQKRFPNIRIYQVKSSAVFFDEKYMYIYKWE